MNSTQIANIINYVEVALATLTLLNQDLTRENLIQQLYVYLQDYSPNEIYEKAREFNIAYI